MPWVAQFSMAFFAFLYCRCFRKLVFRGIREGSVATEIVRELCVVRCHCQYGRLVFVMRLSLPMPPSEMLLQTRVGDVREGGTLPLHLHRPFPPTLKLPGKHKASEAQTPRILCPSLQPSSVCPSWPASIPALPLHTFSLLRLFFLVPTLFLLYPPV